MLQNIDEQQGWLGQTGQAQPATSVPATSVTGSDQPYRCCGFIPFDPEDDTSITNPSIQRRHLAVMQHRRGEN